MERTHLAYGMSAGGPEQASLFALDLARGVRARDLPLTAERIVAAMDEEPPCRPTMPAWQTIKLSLSSP